MRSSRPNAVRYLSLGASVALLLLVSACSDTAGIEQRLDALEDELDSLPSRTAPIELMGDLIVVGISDSEEQVCVRFRAYGRTEETCLRYLNIPELADRDTAITCWVEATVGEPLPESCR